MPFFLPNGMVVVNEIQRVVREQLDKRGYDEIRTPHMLDVELWKRSGHWDNYRENMFFTEAERAPREFAIKPMNCPGRLPGVRRPSATPTATCRCASPSSGSARATSARACCTACCACARSPRTTRTCSAPRTRSCAEVRDITEAIDELYALFGFDDVRVELSTRPEKSIGTDEQWETAEAALAQALERDGPRVQAEPGRRRLLRAEDRLPHHRRARAARGSAAPASSTSSCRSASTSPTPTPDDTQRTPVMIHRALLGSIERFLGILIEHYAGDFPVWLAPVQARVLPIADRHADYAERVRGRAARRGRARRASTTRSESVGPQDPRRRAGEGPVHAGRGRQGAGAARASPCAATARAIWA